MERFDQYILKAGDLPVQSFFSTSAYVVVTCVLALVTFYYRFKPTNGLAKFPDLDPLKPFEFTNTRRTRRFIEKSIDTFLNGRLRFGDQPYKLATEWGECVVLSPKILDELKSDKRLDFASAASDDMHGYVPGFEPFAENPAMIKVVTRHLTKSLTKITAPLSEVSTAALRDALTDSPEWHDLNVADDIMSIVSRLSSRVFMGPELCQDDGWNKASTNYTKLAFQAGEVLRDYPRWARPLVHWFMPSCWAVRRALGDAKRYLQPHIERRSQLKHDFTAQGKDHEFNDSIEWFEQEQSGRDPATSQITLSLVAIHTTTDLLSQTIINIALHPELFEPLRAEAISVLSTEGLKKTALYNLKLMDSVIKETQRLKPVTVGGFRRVPTEDITLSDGTLLKKGAKVLVDSTHMWSTEYYENPNQFDGYRFFRMREADQDSTRSEPPAAAAAAERNSKHAHLVSTSPGHIGFGHGLHSCPGRFFAANEIKIALCHLLLMYDWKVPDEIDGNVESARLKPVLHGMSLGTNPGAKLLVRRREDDIDFSSLIS